MINICSIRKLKNNEGLTLKNGKPITYKTGWQVATEGVAVIRPELAIKAVKTYGGNCGIWYSDGIYYVDKSRRVTKKSDALALGKACNQITILGWKKKNLVYCQ